MSINQKAPPQANNAPQGVGLFKVRDEKVHSYIYQEDAMKADEIIGAVYVRKEGLKTIFGKVPKTLRIIIQDTENDQQNQIAGS